jgi:hypothetical protein
MTRYLPKINVKDVWSYNFLETSLCVFAAHKINKLVINFCSMRKEECASGCIFRVPEKQFLVCPDDPVVSLGCLFSMRQKILQLLFLGK